MNYFGEKNCEKVKKKIDETLAIDENNPRISSSEFTIYGKVICSYLKDGIGNSKYVGRLYNNYLEAKNKENESGYWAGDYGLRAARSFRLVNDMEMYQKVLDECTPYIFGVKTNGDLPTEGYSYSSGEILRDQLHVLMLQKKFFGFYAQTSTERSAYILGYTPKMVWRESNYIDLIYSAKCIAKEVKKEVPGADDAEDWWIDVYHSIYQYNVEEISKDEYAQIARNTLQKIIDRRRFDFYGDGAYIIDLVLEYPEIFKGALEGNLEVKKVKAKLEDFNKLIPSSPLTKDEALLLKQLKKEANLNFGLEEKPLKLKKTKDFIENLIITMHNEKDSEKELLEELNSDREIFVHYKFYRYVMNLYRQTVCYRLLNLDDESRDAFEKLKVLVEENEEYLYKNLKMLWLGYGYFFLALLEKTKGWDEENYDMEIWQGYLEKSKFYLAADRKEEELEDKEFSETMDFDELADSYVYNAYAHLMTGDTGEFKSSIYVSGMDLEEWDVVKEMALEGMVVGNASVKKLINSGEELVEINKIRGERIDSINNKLVLVKKIDAYNTAKNKDKANEDLIKIKEKIYNGITEVNEVIDLIPFILGTKII